jgi:SAM-dependent methyltransferase
MMTTARQRITSLLRKARLLTPADRAMLLFELLKRCRSNRRFVAEHPGFAVPPAALAYDAYNHVNWREYHDSGILHARLVAELIRKHLANDPLKVCEWGCGPGRVIRHLRGALADRTVELFGTDYNPASVAWCRTHLPGVEFRHNGLEPPLPFESGTLDVLYAISVFTHLSAEGHSRWIDEIFRVVRPSGIVIFTTHGDACTHRLLPPEQRQYQDGELVVRGGVYEGSKCFVAYHPPAYVRRELLRGARVVAHLPSPAACQMVQDVWVASKNKTCPTPRDRFILTPFAPRPGATRPGRPA